MNNLLHACECGSNEFITKPNVYDVYNFISGKLEFKKHEFVEDKVVLYCRICGKEFEGEIFSKDL